MLVTSGVPEMGCFLRWAGPSDHAALSDIMFDAVRNGPSAYSEQQRQAWLPVRREGKEWDDRLAAQDVILAELGGKPVGFMSLAGGGYIDFAYIRPAAQGTGLFRQLIARIEDRARANGVGLLWVHASLAAHPAFAAVGFVTRKQEEVELGTERLKRFEMEKALRG
jgi:putative acetyltransferase